MTIRSDTHKGYGFNELRFEDENDQEEVFFHAEKFHNAVIKDNETWLIGGNRHKRVDASQSESIGGDKDAEVGGNHREHINGSHHIKIEGSRLQSVGISDYLKVVGDKISHIVRDSLTHIGQSWRLETKDRQHFEAGTTHYINAGDAVVIQAGSAISLNVGSNFIRIDAAGVQIEGTLVKVNCGGSPTKGHPVSPQSDEAPDAYGGPHAERYPRSFQR
jgi:type VI secretion system secreted protein VgrG